MGRRIMSDEVVFGRNTDSRVPADGAYVRCSRCGFICNTERDERAFVRSTKGWGISYGEATTTIAYDDSSTAYDSSTTEYDGTITGTEDTVRGCPFCGTYLYAS